jgi:hypothetical protein
MAIAIVNINMKTPKIAINKPMYFFRDLKRIKMIQVLTHLGCKYKLYRRGDLAKNTSQTIELLLYILTTRLFL